MNTFTNLFAISIAIASTTCSVDRAVFLELSNKIGGTVTGLNGAGLVLQDNGGDDLALSVDGSFAFETPVASGTAYSVSVLSNPPGRICTVTNGSGTVAATNVSTVMVTCSRLPLPPPVVYSNVGAVQTLVIPPGVQSIVVKAWGAGGGGASAGGQGGGGGFSNSTPIPVTAGEPLTIVVGQGGGFAATTPAFGGGGFRNPGGPIGCNGTFFDPPISGGGGGYSGVFRGTAVQANTLLIAGGGGGGGDGTTAGAGGGDIGGVSNLAAGSAGAGTQTAGGSGGVGATAGFTGSALQGGNGDCAGQAGAGGGGYFGGGGSGAVNGMDAGGAGGSGYAPGGITVAGSGATPAMTSDPDYANGLAIGGMSSADGGDGRVVITFF